MVGGRPEGAGKRFPVSVVLALLGVSTLLSGRTITVDDSGGAEFQSIQAAINAAVPGDVVSVAPGLYLENLALKSGVSVVGAGAGLTTVDGGGLSWTATLLNCDASTRLQGFTLTNGRQQVGAGVFVSGGAPVVTLNRITGNTAVSSRLSQGGGIALQNSAAAVSDNLISNNQADFGGGVQIAGGSPLITRNQITGNVAGEQGGGIALQDSQALVSDNLIVSNSADYGAGLEIRGGAPLITHNQINGNVAVWNGGGLEARSTSTSASLLISGNSLFNNTALYGGGVKLLTTGPAIVTNNLITGNTAAGTAAYTSYGGGIDVVYSSVHVTNNTIVGNKADIGGGAAVASFGIDVQSVSNNVFYDNTGSVDSGGLDVDSDSAQVLNNIFFSNLHNDCGGTVLDPCSNPSNLFLDPRLVDPRRSDYRLQPGSPAIDSGALDGAPADDYRGQQRPLDGNHDGVATVDRGAYEFDRNDILGLIFSPPATLSWPAATGAASYHVYSGALSTLAGRGLDTCRDSDDPVLTDLIFSEGRTPLPGSGFAYVVVAVIGGVETSPGFDSRGIERTLPFPCP
jgi:hypothetical protein